MASSKKTLKRPNGKRLKYCLTFLRDHDSMLALERAGYARPNKRIIESVEKDPAIQQEINNIQRFAVHFYENLDVDQAFCHAYDVHNSDVHLYEDAIQELMASSSVESALKAIRSGQVEIPQDWREFVDEYLRTSNMTQSALKVWPNLSYHSAAGKACRLLKKASIQDFLRKKRKELEDKLDISPEWVLGRLVDRVDAKLTDYVDIASNGRVRIKAIGDLPESKQRLLRALSNTQNGITIKIPDGVQELMAIARILGMFDSDWNAVLAATRKFGYVIKTLPHGGYELIPEDRVVAEGLGSLDDYDEPTPLPWSREANDD